MMKGIKNDCFKSFWLFQIYGSAKDTGRYSWMDLATSEIKMKYQFLTQPPRILANERAKRRAQEDLHSYSNYVCCNVFCEFTKWSPMCTQT